MAIRIEDGEAELAENNDINVTPFIDVMLVLLIIFMVVAPLATVDVPVELPVSTADPQPKDEPPVFLSVQSDLSLAVGDTPVKAETLGPVLDEATKGDKTTRIFVRADKKVNYGSLMDVMNQLRGAGYLKVALVGLEPSEGAAGQ